MTENTNVRKWTWRGIMNFLAFVATVCIGVSLALSKIGAIATIFKMIAEIISFSLTAFTALFYVIYKRHWAYYLVWAICVVLIIVLLILK